MPGIGGKIKIVPEDFVVEEITPDGKLLKVGKVFKRRSGAGDFTHFVLQKKCWNTVQALHEIGKKLGCTQKRFGYAGLKDRRALTVQLCSVWGATPEQLNALRLRDIQINGAWRSNHGIQLGDLAGNAFIITVRGIQPRSSQCVKKILSELNGQFPNYFGEQRFGTTRFNTHTIGKLLLKGDIKGAVNNYLCFTQGEENQSAREARERLAEENDYLSALDYFPRHLKYERIMLRHLAEFKNDYAGALRALPRGVLLMFVHAYQAFLFNELLSLRIQKNAVGVDVGDYICPANKFGFPDVEKARKAKRRGERGFLCLPIIGYETEDLCREAEILLENEGLTTQDFRIKQFPELSSKGSLRPAFVPLKGFKFVQKGNAGVFSFTLPPGSYATSALREFLDENK